MSEDNPSVDPHGGGEEKVEATTSDNEAEDNDALSDESLSDQEHPFAGEEEEEEENLQGNAHSRGGDMAMYARPPFTLDELKAETQVFEAQDSPAFVCLEEMFHQGKLTGTEVSLYKSKFMLLHDLLKRSRENEFTLLQQSKRYTRELEEQQAHLIKADDFPENVTTEVGRLREQLLRSNNTIAQCEDRNDILQYKITALTEEKKLLEREYARMPKQEELRERKKKITDACADLKTDIEKQILESRKFKETLHMSEEEEKSLHPQLDDALKEEDRLKAELVSLLPIPGQYSKEADKYKRQLVEVQIQLEEIKKEFDDAKAVESLERIQLMKLEQQAEEIRFLQTKNAEETAIAQEKYAEVTRKLEYAKDQEATLVTDKTTLDLNFRHFQLERKNLYESHTNRLYEKDRELRKLKKAQSQLKVLQEGLILTEQMLARTRDAYESIPKDDSMVVAERKKISTENTNLNRLISQQKSMSVTEQVQFEQATSRQKALTRELEECRVVSVELKRMAAIKYDEREQKARDYSRADLRYHRTMDDLKTKDLQINEHKKKFQEVAIKLNQHAKHFEVIKGERNKIVNLLQSTTQKALEMREKIRIMDNEMEILRTTLSHRDKQLQKVRMRHANAIVSWDNLRVELSHQTQIENEQREERNQIQLDIQRLTAAMNHLEETMVQLRKQKERLVQFRNDRAVQLIERNEEVYILQEKVRLQGGLIQRGEVEMQALDDQIAFLKRQVQEVKRSIHILKKKFPQKRSLESELLALQIQLSICQDRVLDLESQAENPMENGRLRILDGPDASPVELQQQLETLEKRLSKKEESLLEKELLSDAVTRLLQQIQGQAMHGKDDTLALAKDVNQYKYKMNRVTKRMKATTAEMTMYMAETMKLEQEVRAREQLIQSCYQRMERGEPPSDDIENEWKKKLERSRQRQKELEQMKEVEDEEAQFTLANGGVTAAEPRPNAYLPDDEEGLPLPKPYGVHAPFRPTENGSNMRHIRKPKLKPIEI